VGHEIRPGCLKVVAYADSKLLADDWRSGWATIDLRQWSTVSADRPREARKLTLFDTQADAHAEIIRLRERGGAHVFALPPVAPCVRGLVGTPRP
jgi:hypothetical protein